jgi:hypothetical protein
LISRNCAIEGVTAVGEACNSGSTGGRVGAENVAGDAALVAAAAAFDVLSLSAIAPPQIVPGKA